MSSNRFSRSSRTSSVTTRRMKRQWKFWTGSSRWLKTVSLLLLQLLKNKWIFLLKIAFEGPVLPNNKCILTNRIYLPMSIMKTGSEFQKVRMLFQSLNRSKVKGHSRWSALKVKDNIKLISEAYNLIFESLYYNFFVEFHIKKIKTLNLLHFS